MSKAIGDVFSEMELHCLARHVKEMVEKGINDQLADLAQPCVNCPHVKECGFGWNTPIYKLAKAAGVKISFFVN